MANGNATVTALLKPGKDAIKASNGMMKSRMTIMKSAVKSYTAKKAKYKVPAVKAVKLPKIIANPSMGKFLTSQISKAKFSFKKK